MFCDGVVHARTYKSEEKESRLESDLELDPAVYKREIAFNGHKKWGEELLFDDDFSRFEGKGKGWK